MTYGNPTFIASKTDDGHSVYRTHANGHPPTAISLVHYKNKWRKRLDPKIASYIVVIHHDADIGIMMGDGFDAQPHLTEGKFISDIELFEEPIPTSVTTTDRSIVWLIGFPKQSIFDQDEFSALPLQAKFDFIDHKSVGRCKKTGPNEAWAFHLGKHIVVQTPTPEERSHGVKSAAVHNINRAAL